MHALVKVSVTKEPVSESYASVAIATLWHNFQVPWLANTNYIT